jgi:hypothetical protein
MNDEDELAAMANDPDIQREIEQIQAEFEVTENDGLTDDVGLSDWTTPSS